MERTLTNLGNLASALTVAMLLVVWTWSAGNRLLALTIGGSVVATVLVTAGLKMIAIRVNPSLAASPPLALTMGAPSGHAAIATMVYGAAAMAFYNCRRGWPRSLGLAWSLLAIIGVAVTRVTLDTHTFADVVAGMSLAAVMLIPVVIVRRRTEKEWSPGAAALLAGMVLIAVAMELSGVRISSTEFLL